MTNLQKVLDLVSEAQRETRSKYHLTLGQLLIALDKFYGCKVYIGRFASFRGHYSDLSVHIGDPMTCAELAAYIRAEVLDKPFEGHKGGMFIMGENTPLWWSLPGVTDGSEAVTGFRINGRDQLHLVTKDIIQERLTMSNNNQISCTSLREHYAGLAMQGFVANGLEKTAGHIKESGMGHLPMKTGLAILSVSLADALIEVLQNGK